MKITLSESKLKNIISESIKKCLSESIYNMSLPEILRQDPSLLSNEDLKYALKYLSANADEYSINDDAQMKFDAFWNEWNNRQGGINEAYETVQWQHFDNDNLDNEYYNGFVIVDGTRAVLGKYDSFDEAVEDAREMARQNKFASYEVYGCDENGYALEEDFPEDNTLVYSTNGEI